MVVRVLCSIALVSNFHLLHYVQCRDGQCSRLYDGNFPFVVNGICVNFNVSVWASQPCNFSISFGYGKIHQRGEPCHYQDVKYRGFLGLGVGALYQVDCYCKITHEIPTSHERYRCIAEALKRMKLKPPLRYGSLVQEGKRCIEENYQYWSLESTSTSTTMKVTSSPATTTGTTTTPTPTTITTTTSTITATTTPTTTFTTTSTTTIMTTPTTSTTTTASTTEFVDTFTATASATTTTALSTLTSTVPYVTETTTTPSIEPLLTTIASSTSTDFSELSSIDQGGINETVVISPEREKEYIRTERKRVLDSAKLKLLVISTLMTTGLSIQLLLIRQLRKLLREWYESGLLVEDGVANAVIKMAAKKMKSAGRKKMKAKRKARAKKIGRKPKTHRDSRRTPKKGSANVGRSRSVSSDDNTTDLYNFYEGKQKGSEDSHSKESNRSKDTSSEGKSMDSKEGHGKKGA
ncbi:hypothetical protein GCK32_002317 [Trichostrongylus colubriformis]|uniref:Uncharacterized protein n=1 Tax=Trichostrongylus colubriformis TaxID=6319 RepID=A0AAN8F5Y8_TRICO